MKTTLVRALSSIVCGAAVGALALGCKDDKPDHGQGAPPPPTVPTAQAGACAAGGGKVDDDISRAFFPRVIADYCIDPKGDTKTYGEGGKLSMDEMCTTAFDGECEVYKRFGVKRVVALRYVDGQGKGGSAEVILSTFASPEGAYAMFTKRVVADADPSEARAPRIVEGGGAAAMGSGRGYVWRGSHLVELTYINEQESPDELVKSANAVLPKVARGVGEKLSGDKALPRAAAALPTADRIKTGLRFYMKDPLGLGPLGPSAVGYYKKGTKRFRLLSVPADDVGSAKDAFAVVKKRPGSTSVSKLGDEAVLILAGGEADAPKTEWIIARKGALVVGMGDEEFAMKGDVPLDQQSGVRLDKAEKIEFLKAWIEKAPEVKGDPTAKKSPKPKVAPDTKTDEEKGAGSESSPYP